jgi:hypothetical protein
MQCVKCANASGEKKRTPPRSLLHDRVVQTGFHLCVMRSARTRSPDEINVHRVRKHVWRGEENAAAHPTLPAELLGAYSDLWAARDA